VLALVDRCYSSPEIAEALFVSVRTAEYHGAAVFNKIGVNSHREAATLTARHGLA
jgi:DNA-binding NarL/FixJ family response regulator